MRWLPKRSKLRWKEIWSEPTLETVLCWIQNDKHWKQYVKHHVHEIRQTTAKKDWRYCPGVQNAADLPSRGLTGNKMVDNSLWWCGPQFLQLLEEWPQEQATIDTNEAALSEVVKNPLNAIHGASILWRNPDRSQSRQNHQLSTNQFSWPLAACYSLRTTICWYLKTAYINTQEQKERRIH